MKKFILVFGVLVLFISTKSFATHGLPFVGFNAVAGPTGITVSANSDPATCGSGPYWMQVEVVCSASGLSGLPPASMQTTLANWTGPGVSYNSYPWYNSLLNVPSYNAASSWPDACTAEAYHNVLIPYSDLCPGQVYFFAAREWVGGSNSPGPWTTAYSFTVPGVLNPLTFNLNASTTSYCAPGSSNLSVTGANAPCGGTLSYLWSPGGATTSAITVSPGSTTTYSVAVTSSQCQTLTKAQTITVSTPPVANAGASPGTITCATKSLTLNGSGGGTYSWSGPPGGIASGGATASPTVTLGGNYVVTVSSPGCPSSTATVTIPSNTTAPSPSASNSSTLNCTTTSISLTGGGGGTYSWSGPGIVSGGTTSSPSVNAPGLYVVTVTAANGCTATANTTVSQNTTAPSPTASNSTTLTCSTTSGVLTGGGGGTYSWSGPGITGGGATSTPTVNAPGLYVVTVTAANGCTATANTTVSQNITLPSPTASNTTTLTCLTTNAVLTGGGGGTYSWSGPGITGGGATSTPTVNAPGLYVVTVTAANGCTATANTTVSQNTLAPSVTSSATNSLTCSTLTTQVVTSTTTSPVSYTWTGSGILAGSSTASATVNGTGPYSYTVTGANGCRTSGTQAVVQNTTTPSTIASTSGSITCVTNTINLNSTAAGLNYTWTAPGGSSIVSGSNFQNATGQGIGIYTLNVINPLNNCTYSTTTSANINTVTPTGANAGPTATISCGSPSVTLSGSFATPVGATATWLGGVCGSSTNFTTQACAAGIYTLVVTNPVNSCTTSATTQVFSSTGVPTGTLSPVTNSITCTNSLVAIGVTSTVSPLTILWTGPGTISSPSTALTNVNAGGTYTVLLTNPSNSCTATLNVTVPSNTTPITPVALGSGSITCTNTLVSLSSIPVGSAYTYSWTGTGITTGSNTSSPSVNQGGNFVLTVTSTLTGCNGSYTLNVPSNTIAPTVTVSPSTFTTSCASPTVQLIATSTNTNVSYAWTTTGGSLNNTTISNPIANGGGTYNVTVTNPVNGCTSATTATVVPDAAAPTATISAATLSLTCNTASQSATITTTPTSNLTYSWSPAPATGSNAAVATFTTNGTYICTITNTVNMCTTSSQVVVNNTVAPVVSTISNPSITCSSPTAVISTTTSPASGVTYSWTGTGIVGSTTNSSVTVNQGGNFVVTVINSATGCSVTATSTVTSNSALPTITVAPTSTVLNCSNNSTITLNASSSTTTAPVWSTPTSTLATNPVNASVSGNYVVTVTDANSGCSASQTVTITGSNVAPVINTNATGVFPCGASTTTLNATSTSTNVIYNWSTTNGSIISGSNTASPTIGQTGVYTVLITDAVSTCTSVATVTVTQGNVTAGIVASPTIGIAPLTVNFNEACTGATSYDWTFGNSNPNSTNPNPSNIYTSNGTYTVMLVASAGSGTNTCSDTAYVTIIVNDGLTLEIPNVFTPNNDGTNDFFTIKSTGIKEITLQIFNRWGEKLYDFVGPKASWDGLTAQGGIVPDGTYFYFVKATGFDDKEIEKNGTVNLFR